MHPQFAWAKFGGFTSAMSDAVNLMQCSTLVYDMKFCCWVCLFGGSSDGLASRGDIPRDLLRRVRCIAAPCWPSSKRTLPSRCCCSCSVELKWLPINQPAPLLWLLWRLIFTAAMPCTDSIMGRPQIDTRYTYCMHLLTINDVVLLTNFRDLLNIRRAMKDAWNIELHEGFRHRTATINVSCVFFPTVSLDDRKMQRTDQLRDDLQRLQKNRSNIRNICILAHVDHGTYWVL
jgi:hypothetical protein